MKYELPFFEIKSIKRLTNYLLPAFIIMDSKKSSKPWPVSP